MEILNRINYVRGSSVFFVSKGVPHTGFVKDIHTNNVVVENVTFLSERLDRDIWKVNPKDIIKSDAIILPKFPSASEQIIMASVIHNCACDNGIYKVDYKKFFKYGPKRSLFSNLNSKIYFYKLPDNYIEFDNFTVIDIADGVIDELDYGTQKFYRIHEFIGNITKHIINVVEEYQHSINIPDRIFVPDWKDAIRSGFSSTDKIREDVDDHYKYKYYLTEDILDRIHFCSSLNENSITQVYHINQYVRYNYNITYTNQNKLVRQDGNGLHIDHSYYDTQLPGIWR